jgi:hypothetical protein
MPAQRAYRAAGGLMRQLFCRRRAKFCHSLAPQGMRTVGRGRQTEGKVARAETHEETGLPETLIRLGSTRRVGAGRADLLVAPGGASGHVLH